jgi:maleate isomerase
MTGHNHQNASGVRVAPEARANKATPEARANKATLEARSNAAAPKAREYGRAGLFGILTPQGNPTVEPELRILLPARSSMLVSRLTSRSGSLRQRLIDYSERLGESIDSFDDLAFDAIGFACTGSSYLVDGAEERRRLDKIQSGKGYPVVTAADAIADALVSLGVGAIALISPYPDWLTDASRAHWERAGLKITAVLQLPSGARDAHGIYALTTPKVLETAANFDPGGAEAILVTGTGMPSLRAILALEPSVGLPVLSSNLCLAWALAKAAGRAAPGPESPLYGGWAERLVSA